MAKGPRPWTVLPHGPMERLEENLWSVEGSNPPPVGIPRRMAIVRLSDGRLLFHNAIPLDDVSMRAIEAWGTPAFLVVPNDRHRLDAHAYKARYPDLQVLCPAPVAAKVRQAVRVGGHFDRFVDDPACRVEPLDGIKTGEGVLIVHHRRRVTLLFGDALMNLRKPLPGLEGTVLRWLGSMGGPKLTRLGRWALLRDPAAFARHLDRLAALPGLTRLIFSHGETVDESADEALHQASTRVMRQKRPHPIGAVTGQLGAPAAR